MTPKPGTRDLPLPFPVTTNPQPSTSSPQADSPLFFGPHSPPHRTPFFRVRMAIAAEAEARRLQTFR